MKQIKKAKGLDSLLEHSKKEHANYENYLEKDDLRKSLCTEQRDICCYCMGFIKADINFMKIEHFKCQENYPEEQLQYKNLLGACKGNEGEIGANQHCDTFKRFKDLKFNPADTLPRVEDLIWYGNDGTIGSLNKDLDNDINEILNLNVKKLKNNRKAALDGFKNSLSARKTKIKKQTLQRWLNNWDGNTHSDNLQPYCMVIVFWLQKRIKRA